MNVKIEIKVKQKDNKVKQIEYVGHNRMRYVHYLEKGTSKIYVYSNNLDIVTKLLKDLKLTFELPKDLDDIS